MYTAKNQKSLKTGYNNVVGATLLSIGNKIQFGIVTPDCGLIQVQHYCSKKWISHSRKARFIRFQVDHSCLTINRLGHQLCQNSAPFCHLVSVVNNSASLFYLQGLSIALITNLTLY